MTRLMKSLGIAVTLLTVAPAGVAVAVPPPVKHSYVGNFGTQQACESNRALNTLPGDPSVATFPCFLASSSSQLSLAPGDWSGPGWYYHVITSLA